MLGLLPSLLAHREILGMLVCLDLHVVIEVNACLGGHFIELEHPLLLYL